MTSRDIPCPSCRTTEGDHLAGCAIIRDCSDCSATWHDCRLHHDAARPIGRDIDLLSNSDRLWFDTHPSATEFRRELHWSERQMVLEQTDATELVGRVRVVRVSDGVRHRDFSGVRGFVFVALTSGSVA